MLDTDFQIRPVRSIYYINMLQLAIQKGYPEAYKDDILVHDRNVLFSDDFEVPFGWQLRDAGTDFLYPGSLWGKAQENTQRNNTNVVRYIFTSSHYVEIPFESRYCFTDFVNCGSLEGVPFHLWVPLYLAVTYKEKA